MARVEMPVARLGWLLNGEFSVEPFNGPARLAASDLVHALRVLQRVEALDEATCSTAVLLGESVDADPTNAALWGQFRAALADLRSVGAGDSDAFEELLAELSAPIPNSALPESGDARATGVKGGEAVGSAVDGTPAVSRGRGRGVTS